MHNRRLLSFLSFWNLHHRMEGHLGYVPYNNKEELRCSNSIALAMRSLLFYFGRSAGGLIIWVGEGERNVEFFFFILLHDCHWNQQGLLLFSVLVFYVHPFPGREMVECQSQQCTIFVLWAAYLFRIALVFGYAPTLYVLLSSCSAFS